MTESEERYRTLASSSPDMVFATDAEGRYTFLSDRAETMLGWDREALARPVIRRVRRARARADAAVASYQAVARRPHERPLDADGLPRRRRRTRVQLEINVLGKVEDGALVGINGVARDVSERERLERELSQSEERYRFLVQNSPDVVFSTDAEGRFTFLSDAIERVDRPYRDELIGKHFGTLVDRRRVQSPAIAGRRSSTHPDRGGPGRAQVLRGRDGRREPVDVRAIGVMRRRRTFAGDPGRRRAT